jgi:anti-anti-sigma factor
VASSQLDDQPVQAFRVDVEAERHGVRVAPVGELDLATVAHVQDRVRELHEAGVRRVVIDLRKVTFIDSTGLRLIIALDAAARRGGPELRLIPGSRCVQRVFEMCGLLDRLPFQGPTSVAARADGPPRREGPPTLSGSASRA